MPLIADQPARLRRPASPAQVEVTVRRLGGTATYAELAAVHRRVDIEQAVAAGTIVRLWRGRYALPTAKEARAAAHRLSGVAIRQSAAAYWGWKMQWTPREPQIAVPRGRKVAAQRRAGVRVSWSTIPATDIAHGWVTTPIRTLMDCVTHLPFSEALAIADSALRSGLVTREQARAAALRIPARAGRARVLRVIEAASPLAANPFESVLRSHLLDLPADLKPQVRIDDEAGFVGRVDLADKTLLLVVEGESFEFHSEAEQLDRDCKRYTRLGLAGWLVLRFTWWQVMFEGEWVRAMVAKGIALRQRLLAA
ncbi:type IV toxin-antitoxin system AbiEi family antitoxin domain-containing protein [Actinomycetota bacterium]